MGVRGGLSIELGLLGERERERESTFMPFLLYRKDSSLQNLVSICFSVNCFPSITAWEHTFAPKEYLVSHLEDLFMK